MARLKKDPLQAGTFVKPLQDLARNLGRRAAADHAG